MNSINYEVFTSEQERVLDSLLELGSSFEQVKMWDNRMLRQKQVIYQDLNVAKLNALLSYMANNFFLRELIKQILQEVTETPGDGLLEEMNKIHARMKEQLKSDSKPCEVENCNKNAEDAIYDREKQRCVFYCTNHIV